MGARRVDESLRQRSSGSNNHKTPAGAAAAPQAKRTLPSNHASFTLTCSASARCPHRLHLTPLLIRSPCPAVPFPAPAICIYSEEAAAAASEKKKNENFFHLFEGFPATRTHPLPPALLFLYMYIYFCRVEEEKIFFL